MSRLANYAPLILEAVRVIHQRHAIGLRHRGSGASQPRDCEQGGEAAGLWHGVG